MFTINTSSLSASQVISSKPATNRSQAKSVLTILQNRHSASVKELEEFGINSPRSVIQHLRKKHNIKTFYRKGTFFAGKRLSGEYRYKWLGKKVKGGTK
jgi:hypothetical protein